jgi:hypothetical protein
VSEQYGVLRGFYIETNGTWTKQIVAPVWHWQLGGPFAGPISGFSAFEIAGDLNARGLVGAALTNHCLGCLSEIGLLVNAFASALINVPAGITVTVRFSDGSTARYTFRFNENGEFTYEPGSARSPSGQTIPDIEAPAVGTWYFTPTPEGSSEAERFINYFRARGGNVIGAGSPARITCTWDGQTLTCTIHTT